MVNFRRLADRARKVVDKRGGTGALKEDAQELRGIVRGKGSLKDKAKAAGEAIKDPGAKGPDRPRGERAGESRGTTQPPGERPEADRPDTRSK